MEPLNPIRSNKWRKRENQNQRPKSKAFALFILLSCSLLLFITYKRLLPPSVLSISGNSEQVLVFPQCTSSEEFRGEKFLWYAPHSGFSNQLSEFKNAILMAAILNRTLIVPPILDHHAVVLGSCPKYVSMTDIIDISSIVSDSTVRVIDFRVFVSKWCGWSIDGVCHESYRTHQRGANNLGPERTLFEDIRKCGLLLSGYNGSMSNCVYAVDEDCRTTVWTYQKDVEDGILDPFQPDDQLKKKKKISFVRRRRDVYRALGPGSEAESAKVLAFGTLFTAPYKGSESYIDIHEARKDPRIQSVMQKTEFLPFVPEILEAGKEFALQKIKAPFLCAQLRLLDGQFKNHWKGTFLVLKQKLESLKLNGPPPIHIFVMTDLPMSNWTGTYLGDLLKDSDAFKISVLRGDDNLIVETANKLMDIARGKNLESVSKRSYTVDNHCDPQSFTDILLYVEQTVCSCASLGFVGTTGSTIAETIELMRKYKACSG
ncbi:unnamed protein product [Coffea canephora]|uniref:O-fucosyltransferase family protein n=2 Tax=Coffea canephora TaxID=49390 RepID=A0A068UNH1_COFCA|nr:unnamed protein product [Coffea canephora]